MLTIYNKNGIEYYSDYYIEKLQSIFFDSLIELDKICRENEIQFFLDAGTAIGAYREGDIVFWDDDMDVSMTKDEYLRLIEILKKNKDIYFLQDSNLTNHCCGYFCKRGNWFTTYGANRRGLSPIKIDIRPLNIIEDSEEEKERNRIYRELANFLLFNSINQDYKEIVMETFVNVFNSNKRSFLSFYNHEYGRYQNKTTGLYVHPYMKYSNEKFYKYDDYFPLKKIQFHGHEFFVPNKTSFMHDYYGDFMKYPPLEVRKPETTGLYYSKCPKYFYDQLASISNGEYENKPIKKIIWISNVLGRLKRY